MNTHRISLAVLFVLSLTRCGSDFNSGIDPVTGEGIESAKQSLVIDDLYAKLREVEGLLPMPAPSETVLVASLSSSGQTTGYLTEYRIDPITRKPRAQLPFVSIGGVELIAEFRAASGGPITVTANGQTVSGYGSVSINLGKAKQVDWTLEAYGWTRADKLIVSRPDVIGAGAFTVAALPISIVYEPPMNQARTNSASVGFRQEMTTITTVSNGSSNSSTPKWATAVVVKDMLNRLANHWKPAAAVKAALNVGSTLMGSVSTSTTNGTTVNSDHTLGLSQVNAQTITTNARLGPGRGDVVVFYKDARVAWGMENGEVTITLIDHGPLAMLTIDTLQNDLAAVIAGGVAPVSGLDRPTLESLIKLDPMASLSRTSVTTRGPYATIFSSAPALPSARFKKDTSLLLSGTSFQNSISHTVTQSDKTSTSSSTTTVKNCSPGWLSLVGIGQTQAGTFTSSISMGSSRTDSVSDTVSASFNLSATAGESYSVDVFYDNIFGSFLTRNPPPPLPMFELALER